MTKVNRNMRKYEKGINIEKMNDSASKFFISTSRITAIKDQERVQNYEDYINDKYLTGAIVSENSWKKTRNRNRKN